MKKLIFTVLALTCASVINAQTIFGKWENRDEKTGKVDSVIEVYEKNGKAFAKITDITDATKRDNICDKCEGENKDKPILGMDILTGLSKDGNEWSGGEILDPKSGSVYSCFIELLSKDKLKVRGYKGISVFGRTVYWYRKQ